MTKQDFYDGTMFDAYKYMGAHKTKDGVTFTVYAPNAKKVSLVGDFNNWEETFMTNEIGFFQLTSKTARYGDMYKYRIYADDNRCVEHTDPYAFQMELRPACCSIITDLKQYTFHDKKWMKNRSEGYDSPINIYELHIGSWKTNSDNSNGWYRYDELAPILIPYLKENHYTHVEFMPLTEYPFDGSWGYQSTGYFAPTKRYGEPHHLMELIDKLHQAGIGAILDFVPVHFAIDSYGLREFDGTALYEYPHGDVRESEWGTCNFLYSRGDVKSFMQSSANFWLEMYHFDGLRMDAVSRMIYWQGDENRGINTNSFYFLKQLNKGLKERHPSAMLIAEDSSSYVGVTKPVSQGGLGFDYKWSLGWMHDTLEYFQTAPEYRFRDYYKLAFAMTYFDKERYILEFSHDENVHGKATITQKMNGQYEDKFPQARALYMFMMVHPGKKLNFMGNEFGQLREWSEAQEQDWCVLKYPIHDAFHNYMMDLNKIYLECTELHKDYEKSNFTWLDCTQNENCIYAMSRPLSNSAVIALFNFSDKEKDDYRLHIPNAKKAQLLLHSDWEMYGGKTKADVKNFRITKPKDTVKLCVNIPAYTGMLFQIFT